MLDYKALLTKEDLVALFDWKKYKSQTQKNYASNVMKSVRELYKKETGMNWEDTLTAKNVSRNVIPTEYFLKGYPEFRKSFRR